MHAPASIRSLRKVPVLGVLIHRLSRRLLPTNERLNVRIEVGPAQGIFLEVNPRTGDAYRRGELELATQEALVERLRPGMIFYDLGANIGLFSLLAARLVGTGGRVFSFEPDAEVAARLRRNIEQNGFSNVTVVEAGVWSVNANLRFVPSGTSSPERSSGKLVVGGSEAGGTPVRCIALDDFIQTAPPPDAIKCDVEGAELEALRGANRLLETRRPWILCEMHSETNDRAARDFLGRLGYEIKLLDVNHVVGLPPSRPAAARAARA
jgi:FkbM family methyltransferase